MPANNSLPYWKRRKVIALYGEAQQKLVSDCQRLYCSVEGAAEWPSRPEIVVIALRELKQKYLQRLESNSIAIGAQP